MRLALIILMRLLLAILFFFFFNDTATTEIYTLSLHDALPICSWRARGDPRSRAGRRLPVEPRDVRRSGACRTRHRGGERRSEEHTSELQSPCNLVCRLLLEKKKKKSKIDQKMSTRIVVMMQGD